MLDGQSCLSMERAGEATTLTPDELRVWLEWAGQRLLALHVGKIKPAQPRVVWPEYNTELFQVLDHRKIAPLRPPAPSSDEIPIVDEILSLPNVCADINTRRILHCRALVHPLKNTYLYNWSKIAALLDVKVYTVKRLYKAGLRETCAKAPRAKVCHIAAFISQAQDAR